MTPAPRPDVDALVAQLDRARADSTLAAAAATAAPPPIAAALNTVAAERTAHVKALSDEITRMSGQTPQATSTSQSTSAAPTSTGTSANRRRHPAPPTSSPRSSSPPTAPRSRPPSNPATAQGCSAPSPRRAPRRPPSPSIRGRRRDLTDEPPPTPRGRRTAPTPRFSTRSPTSTASIYGYGLVSAHSTPDSTTWWPTRWPATANSARRRSRACAAATRPSRCLPSATRCRSRSTARPTPRSWRCGWRRTPRWRGGRCSSTPAPARTAPSR